MKVLRNSPLLYALSFFAVKHCTIHGDRLCDCMGHAVGCNWIKHSICKSIHVTRMKPEDIMGLVYCNEKEIST